MKDHYCLIGVLDPELAAIANARLMNDKVAISLHTITFKRRAGIGPIMYLARMENFVKPKYAARTGQRPVPEQQLREPETLKATEKIDI